MPAPGFMRLYDFYEPGLEDGGYSVQVHSSIAATQTAEQAVPTPIIGMMETPATFGGLDLGSASTYLQVVGPRFSLAATDIAGVYPPRNGHGAFGANLAQVVLFRRTLPWERRLGATIPSSVSQPQSLQSAPIPWMFLLVLDQDTEIAPGALNASATLADLPDGGVSLSDTPSTVRCGLLNVDTALLTSILPSLVELKLLSHVRQVNVDDRTLDAGSSDGWFSVVVANRLPAEGGTYRACLISLEGPVSALLTAAPTAGVAPPEAMSPPSGGGTTPVIVLYSWTFTNDGTGTYKQLMESLDSRELGSVPAGSPAAALDTGHVVLELDDRSGATGSALYRGPFVPTPLGRDSLGPYHSADQARRVSIETSLEDVSYAAAFELGRLLGAANARVAQDLLRWRRESYSTKLRSDTVSDLGQKPPSGLLENLPTPPQRPVPTVAKAGILAAIRNPRSVQRADPSGLSTVEGAPGLNPAKLASAWTALGVTRSVAAQALGQEVVTGGPVIDPLGPVEAVTSVDDVLADTASQEALTDVRTSMLEGET